MTRRRQHRREVYRGDLVLGPVVDVAALKLHRGRHVRVIDDEGNPITDTREPGAMLWLEIGDRAIVAAADLADDAIGCVEVTDIRPDGRLIVQLVGGGVLPLGAVHVMRGQRARRPPRRKASGKTARMPGQSIADLVRRARIAAVGGGS
jgi:hypothetical protein